MALGVILRIIFRHKPICPVTPCSQPFMVLRRHKHRENYMLTYQSCFWKKGVFYFSIIGSALFIVLTVIAMFIYPGGSLTDPTTNGYAFFSNFFSELGFLVTKSGAVNTPSAVLFIISLTLAGLGLVLFFLAFPQFFQQRKAERILSLLGSTFGVLSGICFVGVAWAPGDVNLDLHVFFVMWAFRLFPLAVFFYAIAIFRQADYPKAFGWVFIIFGMLLVAYIFLLEFGPSAMDSITGQVIQAAGQKVIVYASIGSIMVQASGALKKNRA